MPRVACATFSSVDSVRANDRDTCVVARLIGQIMCVKVVMLNLSVLHTQMHHVVLVLFKFRDHAVRNSHCVRLLYNAKQRMCVFVSE